MRNLTQAAVQKITGLCAVAGKPIDEQQQRIIAGVVAVVLGLSSNSDEDIIMMYRNKDMAEDEAAFWLGVDKPSLQRWAAQQDNAAELLPSDGFADDFDHEQLGMLPKDAIPQSSDF